jgi:hypothetical protein
VQRRETKRPPKGGLCMAYFRRSLSRSIDGEAKQGDCATRVNGQAGRRRPTVDASADDLHEIKPLI